MKKCILLFSVLIISLSGCKKDEVDIRKGDCYVSVSVGYVAAEGVEIYTKPATKQAVTDQFGTALLKDIPVGSYEIYAVLPEVGSGKSVTLIQDGELSEVSIYITPGVNFGIAPAIDVLFPSPQANYSFGDTVNFVAYFDDDSTPKEQLQVQYVSDLDGEIFSGNPAADGKVAFSRTNLSRGQHTITITAKDSDNYTTTATLHVNTNAPKSINLVSAESQGGVVNLQWTKYPGTDFLKYEIYRLNEHCSESSAELIYTGTNINTLSYNDETPPFSYQVCYYARVVNSDNLFNNSNTLTVEMPAGYVFNFIPSDMLKHPTQPVVYLVDKGGFRLIKYNYETSEVLAETSLQGTIGKCDIGDNGFGLEIYTPSTDGWVYIYNADDLSLVTSISTGLSTRSVVVNGLGHVIAAVMPSPWWEQPVRTYSRATGINLDGNGDNEGDILKMIPGKNEIISITTSVSPIDMEYFKLTDGGMFEIHQDDQYHGDYPLDPNIFRISSCGRYSITSSYGAVYYANASMEYKGQLQRGALLYSDFAFSDDGSIIYAATSNRKSIQIGHYPSLIRDDEILLRGYPKIILKSGNRIISLSVSDEDATTCGIEIINLD